jgi:hypothetical protein
MTSIAAQIQDRIKKGIEAEGYTIMAIFGSGNQPPFAYTVGLTDMGLPEQIVCNLSQDTAYVILTRLVNHLKENGPQPDGTVVEGIGNLPLALRDAVPGKAEGLAVQCVAWYPKGTPLKFQQLVLPDIKGRFPWHTLYNWPQTVDQPLLYLSNLH